MARILWHSCAPWASSGYGTQTAVWTKKLMKMGHEVVISSYWGLSGSSTTWEGITVLPGFGGSYCSPSLYQHALATDPDLVITLGDVWVLDANLLKTVPMAHWLPCDCRPMSTADRRTVQASGAELIAMSQFGRDRFAEAGFNPVYVPHGIDTGLFRPFTPEERTAAREQLGLGGDDFVIGINGANNDAIRKALPEMMLAFAKFHRAHPEAILALHSGVHQDGGQDLEAVAENLGIVDRCRVVDQYRYHAGFIPDEDMVRWYNALDVLACCSFGEGFGLPIVEAQACGIPVITTAASSMEELNPHGRQVTGEPFWNGVHKAWWCKPSVSQMVDAFEEAYEKRADVDREKLRDFACTYDVDVVARQFMKPAVDELVNRMKNRKQ